MNTPTVLALLYIGGVLAVLPSISHTKRWGMFLYQTLTWPLQHAVVLVCDIISPRKKPWTEDER